MSSPEEVLDVSDLTKDERKGIAGLIACLLTVNSEHDSEVLASWEYEFLKKMCDFLKVPKQIDSLRPLLRAEDDPTPFFSVLGDKWLEDIAKKGQIPLMILHYAVLVDGGYDARVRVLLKKVVHYLELPWSWFEINENQYASALMKVMDKEQSRHQKEQEKIARRTRATRWLKIGTAAAVGGGLLVLTGGLAAPAIAMGFGAIGIGSAGAFFATAAGVATVTAIFGAAGAGMTGYKMIRRLEGLTEFEFMQAGDETSMHVALGVPGWLYESDDAKVQEPWRAAFTSQYPLSEAYTLKWESKALINLSTGLRKFATSKLASTAITESLKRTLLMGFIAALAWPSTILTAAETIDNPWSIAMSKAKKAGVALADALITRSHGKRPISLIGFSMGARVIYFCMEELARRQAEFEEHQRNQEIEDAINSSTHPETTPSKASKNVEPASGGLSHESAQKPSDTQASTQSSKEATSTTKSSKRSLWGFGPRRKSADASNQKSNSRNDEHKSTDTSSSLDDIEAPMSALGIIEDVVLLGTPCRTNAKTWSKFRRIVAGRLVNGYCRSDWLLSFVFRTVEMSTSVAGLHALQNCPGIENVDITPVVHGHLDYSEKLEDAVLFCMDEDHRRKILEAAEKDKKKEEDEDALDEGGSEVAAAAAADVASSEDAIAGSAE